jgi:hypothetical protein
MSLYDLPTSKGKKNKKDLIQVMDTRGNFSMAIKLPMKDYNPNPKSKDKVKVSKKEKNRQRVKKYYQDHPDKKKERYAYTKQWKIDYPEKHREHSMRYYLKKKQKLKQQKKRGKK